MSRHADVDARIARVRRVLAVARRIRDASDPLGVEARAGLAATSGLSREGVELALDECLEAEATDAELARLVARCGDAPRTWVVASANVCTVAARAIALAVATSRRVHVKPSRRDPVLAEILVRELAADAHFAGFGGEIALAASLDPTTGDEVHAYGRDETIAAIAASIPAGVVLRGHGTGFGVAIVEGDADVPCAAAAIARDVVRFDQRGCLSPRWVLWGGASDRIHELAAALQSELALWRVRVPAGALADAERSELALFRRSMESVASVHGDEGAMVVALDAACSLVLPPAARTLVAIAVAPHHVEGVFEGPNGARPGVARFVAAIGRDDAGGLLARAMTVLAPRARASALGEMQRPPLDGPVDVRHLGA